MRVLHNGHSIGNIPDVAKLDEVLWGQFGDGFRYFEIVDTIEGDAAIVSEMKELDVRGRHWPIKDFKCIIELKPNDLSDYKIIDVGDAKT